MIAIDTNILVYAAIQTSPFHPEALALITSLANKTTAWAIPWPCAFEFLRVSTHPKIYYPPMPPQNAWRILRQVMESPSLEMLSPKEDHADVVESLLAESGIAGNLFHDLNIAAICLENGVHEFLSLDRDFLRFPRLKTRIPFSGVRP